MVAMLGTGMLGNEDPKFFFKFFKTSGVRYDIIPNTPHPTPRQEKEEKKVGI